MSTIANKWATLSYPRSAPPRNCDAMRTAVLDAFAAFEPEAIGLEALAFETELSQAEVSNVLIDMARRHELIVTVEAFLIPEDGCECLSVYVPVKLYGSECYSVTMYRLNKEWKEQ